ncbi:hypothetical protein L6452_16866 [Arctium lappa]|uniref:Uncharacterized protein n=1 Tax=Arctium lappa TaxID=4217 RepID=A0ACB9C1V4_ARCLA|nr:hypothetical protein L6452_16866 [Arctium lappa]
MDFDHENVRPVMNKDRLSSLPDELIHQILSCIDSKYAVQTCLLSSRWKLLWTSTPCLNFDSDEFGSLLKFSKFVKHVLSNRNHQINVTTLKLSFHGAASQYFVRKIADYVLAHNVQEINVVIVPKKHHEFPPCLFSSRSLKHFYLMSYYLAPCLIPKTPWDFPALTTLYLQEVTFCDVNDDESVNLFSKCVNLKSLTLSRFLANDVEVFDIITPQLSNLTLIHSDFELINLIAPKLEDLTVKDCSIKTLNAPPGLLSLNYTGYSPLQLSNDGFHSLNKVAICLSIHRPRKPYNEEVARKTINMLQEVRSARFLTLNADVVECISSFPELISHHPSPFSNLICVNIDSSMRKDAYKVKMSIEARNFLLENCPSTTFIMELPEAPPKKPRKSKEAREKEKAELVADIESHMTELQTSIEVVKMHSGTKERVKAAFENLMAELQVLAKQMKESAEMQLQVDQRKVQIENHKEEMQMQVERGKLKLPIDSHKMWLEGLEARARPWIEACVGEMGALVNRERDEFYAIYSKKGRFRSLFEKFSRRQRAMFPVAIFLWCHNHLLLPWQLFLHPPPRISTLCREPRHPGMIERVHARSMIRSNKEHWPHSFFTDSKIFI